MTEAEALQIGRAAVLEAKRVVGSDPRALLAEILRRAAQDERVAEALATAGFLSVQAAQSEKH
jgi:hypothetical protein